LVEEGDLANVVRDPFAELAKFKREFVPEPVVGDIWWLPEEHVGSLKEPPDNAFCLMAAAEMAANGEIARLHYIAGTKWKKGGKTPVIEVEPSKDGLPLHTFFRFYDSRDLDPATIKADGKWRERLPAERIPEIKAAISACKLIKLKRIL
jgi:hypothetical protein